jgi:hypothetical protein
MPCLQGIYFLTNHSLIVCPSPAIPTEVILLDTLYWITHPTHYGLTSPPSKYTKFGFATSIAYARLSRGIISGRSLFVLDMRTTMDPVLPIVLRPYKFSKSRPIKYRILAISHQKLAVKYRFLVINHQIVRIS